MSVQPVLAPYLQTYTQTEPYVTIDEFVAAPNGINLSELVPGQDQATNTAALQETLVEASGAADVICHQVLAATPETFSGFLRVQPDGTVLVPVPFGALVQVNGYSIGRDSTSLTAATDLTGVAIEDTHLVRLPAAQWANRNGKLFVVMQYVAGFGNGYLQVATTVGATAQTIDNALGLVPGMSVSIFDPIHGANEVATLAAVNGNVLTYAAPLKFAHQPGVRITVMPAAIKRAVLLLAAAAIRSRFQSSIVIPGVGGSPTVSAMSGNGQANKDRSEAEMLLSEFTRWM